MDKPLFPRYAEGRNEKIVSNLEEKDGLLMNKTYPFQSLPKR